MSKHNCPEQPKKKRHGQVGFFFSNQTAKMKNGRTYTIVITRTDQLDGLHRAEEEGRPLHQRPTEMPLSRHTGKAGKKPE